MPNPHAWCSLLFLKSQLPRYEKDLFILRSSSPYHTVHDLLLGLLTDILGHSVKYTYPIAGQNKPINRALLHNCKERGL